MTPPGWWCQRGQKAGACPGHRCSNTVGRQAIPLGVESAPGSTDIYMHPKTQLTLRLHSTSTQTRCCLMNCRLTNWTFTYRPRRYYKTNTSLLPPVLYRRLRLWSNGRHSHEVWRVRLWASLHPLFQYMKKTVISRKEARFVLLFYFILFGFFFGPLKGAGHYCMTSEWFKRFDIIHEL